MQQHVPAGAGPQQRLRRLPTFCHDHFFYEFPLYLGIPMVGGIVWTRYVRLKRVLRASPLFEEVLSVPPYALFRTRSFHPIVSVEGAEVRDVVVRPNLIRFTLRARPFQEYEARVKLVWFPGLTATTYPEALSLTVSSYKPWVAEEVSRAWGYRLETRIPFIKLTLVPLAEETVVEIHYRPGSWGDWVSLAAFAVATLALALPLITRIIEFAWVKLRYRQRSPV